MKENKSEAYNHNDISDEILAEMGRNGDNEILDFLIRKYRNFVRLKANKYFLMGGDREDIVQEGMIGLYKAIRDFKIGNYHSFKSFAELCINRQMITAIKTASRHKHTPLNSYISLDKPMHEEDNDRTLFDSLPGKDLDPVNLLIAQEKMVDVEQQIAKLLSDLEKTVLVLYIDGLSYQEIAIELNKHTKSIDNALQRIKRKLERHFDIKAETFAYQD